MFANVISAVTTVIILYKKDKDVATLGYALYQFVHSFASALMFYLGSYIPMPYQLLILMIVEPF